MISSFENSRRPAAFRPTKKQYLRAAGQTVVGDQPIGQGDQKFQLVGLQLQDVDIYAPDGKVINPSGVAQLRSGVINQWMDADLATACFAEARRLADIAVSVANGSDRSQDKAGADALKQSMFWIMMGYNALNVPWYMDPEARKLFRQFIAGPPQDHGGFTATSEFGSLLNYNDQWFVPGHIDPGFSQSVVSQRMQALVRSVPELNDPNTMQVPTLWPITVVPADLGGPGLAVKNPWDVSLSLGGGGSPNNAADPTYADYVENFFVWKGFQDEQNFSLVSPPVYCENRPGSWANCQSRDAFSPAGPNIDDTHPFNGVTNGSWRTFSWQNNPFNPKLISTPLIFYVPWIDAWASSVTSRAPQSIAVAARLYTVYVNSSKAVSSGGSAVFVNQVVSLPGLENSLATTGNEQDAMRIAATAVAGVGAALAVATYGISAIIGGGIALGLTVGAASIRNTPHIARDDLGRFKPIIDRGWLAGNPAVPGDLGRPPISVPAPKGWVRPFAYSPIAPRYSISDFKPLLPPAPGTPGGPIIPPVGYMVDANGNIVPDNRIPSWAWIAGTVALIVVGYVGYVAMTGPSRAASSTTASRNNPSKRKRSKRAKKR